MVSSEDETVVFETLRGLCAERKETYKKQQKTARSSAQTSSKIHEKPFLFIVTPQGLQTLQEYVHVGAMYFPGGRVRTPYLPEHLSTSRKLMKLTTALSKERGPFLDLGQVKRASP